MQAAPRLARILAVVCLAAAGWLAPAAAQDDATLLERRVKSAFLYKFTSYVDWPPTAFPRSDSPVVIGILGDEPLAAELTQMVAGRTLDGRPITVRRVSATDPGQGVHIVFIGRNEARRLAQVARAPAAAPVLLVGESPEAERLGAAIVFVVSDGRVRFDVMPEAAERHGIRLSSRLLAVARNVRSAQ
jgi:hypothetical protein